MLTTYYRKNKALIRIKQSMNSQMPLFFLLIVRLTCGLRAQVNIFQHEDRKQIYEFVYLEKDRLTVSPFEMLPPNRRRTESDTAVESRRKTEFTLIFSLKISHGYGILDFRALTEF